MTRTDRMRRNKRLQNEAFKKPKKVDSPKVAIKLDAKGERIGVIKFNK